MSAGERKDTFRKEYREMSEGQKNAISSMKTIAEDLYEKLVQATDPLNGMEMALAKTKLEESVMWAVKGITK